MVNGEWYGSSILCGMFKWNKNANVNANANAG